MTILNRAFVELSEVSIFYAEAMSAAHKECFDTHWSAEGMFDLIKLHTVFGFIARIANKSHEGSDSSLITSMERESFAGFVLCFLASDQCEVLTLCVLPEWRRKGLATNLMRKVTERAKNKSAKEMFLEVAENNYGARNLYINQGFTEFGRRCRYYQQKESRVDAIQLSKLL